MISNQFQGIFPTTRRLTERLAGRQNLSYSLSVHHCVRSYLMSSIQHSAIEAHEFLKAMANVSESECDCLPDCDMTKFHYTHSTADLM